MNIKELEARSGMTRANIRYYEQEGLLTPARRENGYRDYDEADLETLLRIKLLRRLGFSLEEIRALQSGKADFADAMRSRGEALAAESAELRSAGNVCSLMAEEVTSYSALQPETYLARMETAREIEKKDVSEPHPWRRYFARMIDLALAGLLVSFVQYVLLRCAPNDSTAVKFVVSLCEWGVLITLLEPLFLNRFATTVGKWCMGITVTRPDGEKLSYGEAVSRTAAVWGFGVGLQIPFVSIGCLIWNYYKYTHGRDLEWERDSVEHFSSRGNGKMVLLYAANGALCIALTWLMTASTLLPPCRGELSVADFAENYNYYVEYFDFSDRYLLGGDGTWVSREVGNTLYLDITVEGESFTATDKKAEPVAFSYTVENGVLRGVSWDFSSRDNQAIATDISAPQLAYLSLAAAQRGTNVFNISRLAGRLDGWTGDKAHSAVWKDVAMQYEPEIEGNCRYDFGYFWPAGGEDEIAVTLHFEAYTQEK